VPGRPVPVMAGRTLLMKLPLVGPVTAGGAGMMKPYFSSEAVLVTPFVAP
jgi:hypothetical protein